ncbi:hypothetical protein [Candidatus Chloroploca sp. Khr17]|uniref:hypothetical protein n=1 Tax=Candidatus Chloroploca sp. Khr17 TaxID=2496869 RepID=UPI00101BE2C5|nr:hypothetical protein [Candidatus Chloroploca sp. Khr17]
MQVVESYHRYSRLTTSALSWFSAGLIVMSLGWLGLTILHGVWILNGITPEMLRSWPLLGFTGSWSGQAASVTALFPTLLPPLGASASTMFVTLLVRNAFPAIRTSSVGMLVEFAGTWLPLKWEDLRVLRVTPYAQGTKFLVLVEVFPRRLTPWHRIYSALYGYGSERGFYIASGIDRFDPLLKTILSQSERTARAIEGAKVIQTREYDHSTFFRLFLHPRSFWQNEHGLHTRPPHATNGPVTASYAERVRIIVGGVILLFSAALLFTYLDAWVRFVALTIPEVRQVIPFKWLQDNTPYAALFAAYPDQGVPFTGLVEFPDLPTPGWLLIAAHLRLAVGLPLLIWLRSLVPTVESRSEGLGVRLALGRRWRVIPWTDMIAVKATELSEASQIVLLQARGLPQANRLTSLLYDGTRAPGIVIQSTMISFQPFMEHALRRITRLEELDRPPILQQEAHSLLFWLALQRENILEKLVLEVRDDPATLQLDRRSLLSGLQPMLMLALLPVVLMLSYSLLQDAPPHWFLLGAMAGFWLVGVLEWPLISVVSMLIDQRTGGGQEGSRAFVLYPVSQLPRLLPLLIGVIALTSGLPLVAVLAWLAAIVWSYFLTSVLFEQLYAWRGAEVILGGLMPVVWQLLMMVGYLVIMR